MGRTTSDGLYGSGKEKEERWTKKEKEDSRSFSSAKDHKLCEGWHWEKSRCTSAQPHCGRKNRHSHQAHALIGAAQGGHLLVLKLPVASKPGRRRFCKDTQTVSWRQEWTSLVMLLHKQHFFMVGSVQICSNECLPSRSWKLKMKSRYPLYYAYVLDDCLPSEVQKTVHADLPHLSEGKPTHVQLEEQPFSWATAMNSK